MSKDYCPQGIRESLMSSMRLIQFLDLDNQDKSNLNHNEAKFRNQKSKQRIKNLVEVKTIHIFWPYGSISVESNAILLC